jgi:hypothetical protein
VVATEVSIAGRGRGCEREDWFRWCVGRVREEERDREEWVTAVLAVLFIVTVQLL